MVDVLFYFGNLSDSFLRHTIGGLIGRQPVAVGNFKHPLHVVINAGHFGLAALMADPTNPEPIRIIDGAAGIGDVVRSIDKPRFLQLLAVTLLSQLIVGRAADDLAFQTAEGVVIDDLPQSTGAKYIAIHVIDRLGSHGAVVVAEANGTVLLTEDGLFQYTPRADFHLVMCEKVGNLFTDCAVNILDSSGKAVRSTGFDGLEVDLGVSLPEGSDTAAFTLQVVGAFAIAEDMADWGFEVEER